MFEQLREIFIRQRHKNKLLSQRTVTKLKTFCVFAGWYFLLFIFLRTITKDKFSLSDGRFVVELYIKYFRVSLWSQDFWFVFSNAAIFRALIFPFGSSARNNKIFTRRLLEKRDNSSRGKIGVSYTCMHPKYFGAHAPRMIFPLTTVTAISRNE